MEGEKGTDNYLCLASVHPSLKYHIGAWVCLSASFWVEGWWCLVFGVWCLTFPMILDIALIAYCVF